MNSSFISGFNSNPNIERFNNSNFENEGESESEDVELKTPYYPKYSKSQTSYKNEQDKMALNNPLLRIKQKQGKYPTMSPSPSPTIKPTLSPSEQINNDISKIVSDPEITKYSGITRVPAKPPVITISKEQTQQLKDMKNNKGNNKNIKPTPTPSLIPISPPSFQVEGEIIESFNGSIITEMKNERLILKCILYGLLFYVLAHPKTLRYTSKIEHFKSLDALVLHTILFVALVYLINLVI
jgi:hypothetical protein